MTMRKMSQELLRSVCSGLSREIRTDVMAIDDCFIGNVGAGNLQHRRHHVDAGDDVMFD